MTFFDILSMPSTIHIVKSSKNISILIFLQLSFFHLEAHALLEKKSDNELAHIFESKIVEEKLDSSLNLQCVSKSSNQLTGSQDQDRDPDLDMSDDDFQNYLTQNSIKTEPDFTKSPSGSGICDMNRKEFFSLQLYTGGLYARRINAALRDKNNGEFERYGILIKHIQSALMKLKPYEGFVVRGAQIPKDLLTDHVKGAKVKYESFLSTSLSSTVARSFGRGVRYVIVSKSCRYINPISKLQKEEEVLCLPNTFFQVHHRKDNDQGGVDILMEEQSSQSANQH